MDGKSGKGGALLHRPQFLRTFLIAVVLAVNLAGSGCTTLEFDGFYNLSDSLVERRMVYEWRFLPLDPSVTRHLYRVSESGGRYYLGSVRTNYGENIGLSSDGRYIVYRHSRSSARVFGPGSPLLPSGIYVCGPDGPRRRIVPEGMINKEIFRDFDVPPHAVWFRYTEAVDPGQTCMAACPDGAILPLIILDGTPLHAAALRGEPIRRHAAEVDLAVIDRPSYWGLTALETAVILDNREVVEELLQLGADPEAGRCGALVQAARFARTELLELLTSSQEDIDTKDPLSGMSLLFVCLRPGLATDPADDERYPRLGHVYPLHPVGGYDRFPFPEKRLKTLRWLLERGADPNSSGGRARLSHPLFVAINDLAARPEVVRLLLDYGAEVFWTDEDGRTARERNREWIDSLVDQIHRLEGYGDQDVLWKNLESLRFTLQRRHETDALLLEYEAKVSAVEGPRLLDDFVIVEPGTFRMGSENGEADERPEHPVTISRSFFISKYEITFRQYDEFCEQTERAKPDDQGWGRVGRSRTNWVSTI